MQQVRPSSFVLASVISMTSFAALRMTFLQEKKISNNNNKGLVQYVCIVVVSYASGKRNNGCCVSERHFCLSVIAGQTNDFYSDPCVFSHLVYQIVTFKKRTVLCVYESSSGDLRGGVEQEYCVDRGLKFHFMIMLIL